MDIAAVRSRFSSLGSGFAFFDAPGGTQVPDEVGAAISRQLAHASGNIGAPYATSRRIEAIVEESRARTARLYGCQPDEVIFGANMTSLNFTLTRTLGRSLAAGDEVVVTRLDHDGNVAPWLELAHDIGIVVRVADVHDDTTLDLDDVARLCNDRTRVVAFPWAANSTGTTVDAAAVAAVAHDAGAIAWVDAVQYAPHLPMDVVACGADVVLCSAYKFCGPHLGLGFARRELLEGWRPYKARPAAMEPVGHRFETGTLPYELLAALLACFDYLDSIGGIGVVAAWERQLGERFLAGLAAEEGVNLYGLASMDGRVPTFLVNFDGVPSAELSVALAERGLGVWSHDNYYALGLHERIGWGEALRVGIAHYNTLEEVDLLHETLAELVGTRRAAGEAAHRLRSGERFPLEGLEGIPLGADGRLAGPTLVYFYPKDGTETCTRQALELQRSLPELSAAGIAVVGVSTDDAESHRCFAEEQGLAFPLVSDDSQSLAGKVGVLKDYGEHGVLAARVSFLVDAAGVVAKVFEVDDVVAHPGEVLAAARSLGLVAAGPGVQSGAEETS
ncbi:MAG TPA: cysteine desulfurase-like protein [Acidimicrobiales bacterium]|nr:cysteine desulfurase-like protein [Acidimicrobiales bacterium]